MSVRQHVVVKGCAATKRRVGGHRLVSASVLPVNPDSDPNLNQTQLLTLTSTLTQTQTPTHPHLVLLADATLEETLVRGVLAGAAGVRAGTLLACMRSTPMHVSVVRSGLANN